MRSRIVIAFVMVALLATGCGAAQVMREVAPMAPAADYWSGATAERALEPVKFGDAYDSYEMPMEAEYGTVPADVERMIIYNATLQLVVRDTAAAQEDITAMVRAVGGYISQSSSYVVTSGLMRITMNIRVPAENFDAVMADLRDLAMEVTREDIGSQDVTEEYVDLQSRLRALEAKAERLEQLMEQAEDTEAVLAVYRELSATQQEIERTKGRMQYLERSAAMATITVVLIPDELSKPIEIAGWRPEGTVRRAIESLIRTLQTLVDALIWIVLLVLPVLVVIGLAVFGVIKLLGLIFGKRRRKGSKVAASEEAKQE